MINLTIEEKKVKVKQKIKLKKILSEVDLDIDEIQQLYTPKSSEILKKIFEIKGGVNLHTQENLLDETMLSNFLSKYNDNDVFYFILPEVSLGNQYYETSLPILVLEKWKVNKILEIIYLNKVDFISIFSLDFKSGIIVNGYSDFPGEENNYYDGQVYDYYLVNC
ncbi:hypothetical protein [Acinetobacter gerneri]|uniref:Uncharacterized protein n=1 Tax=Acinetobacter gerneri DSM 14967 = CIP 107464 = MTCC 9824 TaxID=1120926 RepID=N8YG04_9GAMM|nr:hypothetical protein [Acinetobacter gerneri]ENV35591.1 hypothetical protein F960_00196 [Acinetobacter gerneri DSM 14967 = CIP 107464 = MTCC 9824]EPR84379.1 hypothetical protein L289_1472 [Acinetobacter gerneri DSM 14967 = CIP 107464 = MTCC 9824]